jgi:hypothetical protein
MLIAAIIPRRVLAAVAFGFLCFVAGATMQRNREADVLKIDIKEINRRRHFQATGLQ